MLMWIGAVFKIAHWFFFSPPLSICISGATTILIIDDVAVTLTVRSYCSEDCTCTESPNPHDSPVGKLRHDELEHLLNGQAAG